MVAWGDSELTFPLDAKSTPTYIAAPPEEEPRAN